MQVRGVENLHHPVQQVARALADRGGHRKRIAQAELVEREVPGVPGQLVGLVGHQLCRVARGSWSALLATRITGRRATRRYCAISRSAGCTPASTSTRNNTTSLAATAASTWVRMARLS